MTPIQPTTFFIKQYAQAALYDAGRYLEATSQEKTIPPPIINSELRPIILNYTDKSWNWGNGSFLIEFFKLILSEPPKPSSKEEDENKKKENTATWATIGGAILLIIAGFFTGKNYKPFLRYRETAQYTEHVYAAIPLITEEKLKAPFRELVECQLKIDNLRAYKIANYFYAGMGTLVGATALVVGGVLRIHPIISPGHLIVIFSVAMAFINAGVHWSDAEQIRKNYELIGGDKKNHNGWAQHILYLAEPTQGYTPQFPDLYHQQFANVEPSAPPENA